MHGLGYLIDDVTFVLLSKHIFANKGIQIDVHIFEEDVNVFLAE
jgi:hypothetical protein